jgi:predicted GTPase
MNNFREYFKTPGVPLRFEMRKGDNPFKGKRSDD